jgi:protein-S-isoprenylcysteine O-methyltransferase Ste14
MNLMHRIASMVITASAVAIFSAVIVNFITCGRKDGVKRRRPSFVATASMTAFFVFLYLLIHRRIGSIEITDSRLILPTGAAGILLVAAGAVVNLVGRLNLGRNWANQATIYDDHHLVVSGVYSLVRHPLYASLIWMFYGASLAYANAAAFTAVTVIFLPVMYYRARLEENMLEKEFSNYSEYRKNVGMFFIRLPFLSRRK